ncbi:hypothetical protein GCM10009092_17730 [Bowmanella denitrificans]|uniref:Uncharacterized protein n=1 Tax=Bowmanella denitrificans TaxID=366582 RepID=A0ABP3GSL1_9ALTE
MQKIPIAVIVLSALAAGADFYGRLLSAQQESGTYELTENTFEIPLGVLSSEQAESIKQALDKFDKKAPPKESKPAAEQPKKLYVMSKEEQLAQAGALDTLYDGNNKYRLRGTFDEKKSRFAVLEVQDLESGKVEQMQVSVGQYLSGYKLTDMTGQSVTLEQNNRVINLYLFITKNG